MKWKSTEFDVKLQMIEEKYLIPQPFYHLTPLVQLTPLYQVVPQYLLKAFINIRFHQVDLILG